MANSNVTVSSVALFNSGRLACVVSRWIDIACYGIAAGIIVAALDHPLMSLYDWADRKAEIQEDAWQTSFTLAMLLTIPVGFAGRGRWGGLTGLGTRRQHHRLGGHPPLWLAVLVGLVTWCLCFISMESWSGGLLPHPSLLAWAQLRDCLLGGVGAFILCFVAFCSDGYVRERFKTQRHCHLGDGRLRYHFGLLAAPSSSSDTEFEPASSLNEPKLTGLPTPPATGGIMNDIEDGAGRERIKPVLAWFEDDLEIGDAGDDLFRHDAVAETLAKRLEQPGEAQTVMLVGPYGSGKSTVRSLTLQRLRNSPNVVVGYVSLWPFDCPDAAARGILASLIAALAQETNCLSLRGLPDQYVRAVHETAHGPSAFLHLLNGPSSPDDVIDRISCVAVASGVKLVVWIEDIERFANGGTDVGDRDKGRENERLGPIRALLYLLDRCTEISVVVSHVDTGQDFDGEKLARFTEWVPALDRVIAWKIIETGIAVIKGAELPDKQPWMPHVADFKFDASKIEIESRDDTLNKQQHNHVGNALLHIIDSPRLVKCMLRSAKRLWSRDAHQLELESVLVVAALQHTYPYLERWLDEYHHALRMVGCHPAYPGPRLKSKFELRLAKLNIRAGSPTAEALFALVTFLFPGCFNDPVASAASSEDVRNTGTDWGRMRALGTFVTETNKPRWRLLHEQHPTAERYRARPQSSTTAGRGPGGARKRSSRQKET